MVIRLCFGGRGRGGRIAHARCDAARGRNSQLLARSTCWQQPSSRGRAPPHIISKQARKQALALLPTMLKHHVGITPE